MSTLTEIEHAAEQLSATEQEELIRFLTEKAARQNKAAPKPYRTRTHPGRFLVNIDKICELDDL
jgi:hypothetical protein